MSWDCINGSPGNGGAFVPFVEGNKRFCLDTVDKKRGVGVKRNERKRTKEDIAKTDGVQHAPHGCLR